MITNFKEWTLEIHKKFNETDNNGYYGGCFNPDYKASEIIRDSLEDRIVGYMISPVDIYNNKVIKAVSRMCYSITEFINHIKINNIKISLCAVECRMRFPSWENRDVTIYQPKWLIRYAEINE